MSRAKSQYNVSTRSVWLIVLAIVSQWDKLRAPRSRRTAPATSEPTPAGTATEGPVGSDWSGYSGTTPTVVTREPDPRKKGPILFWFTLALIALAEGALGVVDAAGAHIAAPAYPAPGLKSSAHPLVQ